MFLSTDDTIAAIASAPGGGYRGVVRISGPECREVVRHSVPTAGGALADAKVPSIFSGQLRLSRLEADLPVDLYFWSTSRSYTRQPTVELHTVGSPPLLEAALAEVCRHGARLARPGEFTLRAFLAGRLDLTQAEAVLGVIDAGSERQLRAALEQLAGGIGVPLADVRNQLLELLAHLEAGLDFVEEDIEFISREKLLRELQQATGQIEEVSRQLEGRGHTGELPRAVLCGLPNAGKSSLLNALADEDAALVSSQAGTTRDVISRQVCFDGVELELVDTAGLDEKAGSPIEQSAQTLGRQEIENCHLRIWCVDGSNPREQGLLIASENHGSQLVVLTKCDLRHDLAAPLDLQTSSRTGEGLAELRIRIARAIAAAPADAVPGTAARCRESLALAAATLRRALAEAQQGAGEELVAAELRVALDDLGRVLGAVYTDDILDRVFSRFCIGK